MATFKARGFDKLLLTIAQLREIPDDVKLEMCDAAASVAVEEYKAAVPVAPGPEGGQLRASIGKIKISAKKSKFGKPCVIVAPLGKRRDGVKNSTVGFIAEFGAPRRHIPARPWMEPANRKNMDTFAAVEFDVYKKWFDSKVK